MDLIGYVDRGSQGLSNTIRIRSMQPLLSILWGVVSVGVWYIASVRVDMACLFTSRNYQGSGHSCNFEPPQYFIYLRLENINRIEQLIK